MTAKAMNLKDSYHVLKSLPTDLDRIPADKRKVVIEKLNGELKLKDATNAKHGLAILVKVAHATASEAEFQHAFEADELPPIKLTKAELSVLRGGDWAAIKAFGKKLGAVATVVFGAMDFLEGWNSE